MKRKVQLIILYFLASFMTLTSSLAQDEEFIFRNQTRPEYNKNIDLAELNALQKSQDISLIDVRLAEDFDLDPILIPGAQYKDPEKISKWAIDLPKDKKVVLYCVKGAWVSHKAATYLEKQGFKVVTLDGGIRNWKKENGR